MKIKNLILICFSLFLFHGLFAQNAWTEINELKINSNPDDRQIIPQKYKTFEVDITALKELLDAAPERNVSSTVDHNYHLQLPMPDGSFQRFKIEKASILSPELASKFPMIQSYAGAGIDDPTATIRFDLTQKGFHAQIISGSSSTVFIDPYAKGNIEQYIVYYKKDFSKKSNFQCHVEAAVNEVSNEKTSNTINSMIGDCQIRQYRLALACTGEYAQYHGGTVAGALAAMNTTMVRVNGIFERDLSITMELIGNTDQLIYLNGSTDPFDNNNAGTLINQNQTNTDNVIGSANYDIGHVFSTGGGGLAQLNSPCSGSKARGITGSAAPIGDPFDVDYVAHEMGHQYGANHTQNNPCNSSNASVEPGSASTIMGYAGICSPNVQNNSDDYFHAISLQEMMANITGGTSSSCATLLTTNNTAPTCTIDGNHTIPVSTPFVLTGGGFDADNDPMTYCWEQMDAETATMPPVSTNTGGPTFRSLDPSPLSYRYFPSLDNVISGTTDTWEVLPSVSRTMNFRMTVRDNHPGGGCTDEKDLVITTTSAAGPFLVQVPNTAISWPVGGVQPVNWDVAGTDGNGVDCQNVDILLSTDGGNTYPITLASNVPNNGAYNITVPNNATTTARVMVICSDNVFFDISDTNFIIENTDPTFTVSATPTNQSACNTGTVSYNVDVTSILGFDSPVVLSASGQPSGSTLTFSPVTVTPSGTSTMTISNMDAAAVGSYMIAITGTSGNITASADVDLDLDLTVSQAPAITAPANAAIDEALSTSLVWSAVANATSYEYEIATDVAFANIVDTQVGLATNSATASNLSPSSTYYWRVRAVSNCGNGPWADTYTFSTLTCANVTLTLTLDEYGSETTWSIEAGGTTYLSGGPYTNDTDGLVITESVCLPNGCYDFIINDEYGDGICCGYGNGSYSVTDENENTLASGGQFASTETTNFCLSFPTCTDGIMNGDETGVDCGGTSCPSCILNLYVDETATGNNDGSSWVNAFTDLQDALAIGANGIIHVAEGTYKPTTTTIRGISFDIPDGAMVLGGYPAGGGTRDSEAYETILSGNIDNNAEVTGDSYHVVSVKDVDNVTLDGLTIRDGNANDSSSFGRARGGGLYVKGSNLTLISTTVKWNKAIYGGGMFATLSPKVTITESTFKFNRADTGSALYHSNATGMYVESTIITNNTSNIRAAVEVNNSLYTSLKNSIIANNASQNSNAIAFVATNRDQACDIYNCTITGEAKDRYLITMQIGFNDVLDVNIYNSIVAHQNGSYSKALRAYNNGVLNLLTESCYLQGSSVIGTSNGNLYTDVDGALSLEADYSLSAGSPAIDSGNNVFAAQLAVDIYGNTRVVNTVDMGAVETQVGTAREMNDFATTISIFPNPTDGMLQVVTDLENIDIVIFNVLGKQIIQTQAKDIDISAFPDGMYILSVQQNGKVLRNEKVMKN